MLRFTRGAASRGSRNGRAAWGQAVATVGAIAGTKLTGGAEPALASQDSATERA